MPERLMLSQLIEDAQDFLAKNGDVPVYFLDGASDMLRDCATPDNEDPPFAKHQKGAYRRPWVDGRDGKTIRGEMVFTL